MRRNMGVTASELYLSHVLLFILLMYLNSRWEFSLFLRQYFYLATVITGEFSDEYMKKEDDNLMKYR